MSCSRILGLAVVAAFSLSAFEATASTVAAERLFESKVTACEKLKDAVKPQPYSICIIKANTDILSQTLSNENRLGRLYRACTSKFSSIKGAANLVSWCRSQPAQRAKFKIVSNVTPLAAYQTRLLEAYETKEFSVETQQKTVAAQIQGLRVNIPLFLSVKSQLNTSESSIRTAYRQATGKTFAY